MFSTLFEQFLQERRYLKNSSEKTIRFYKQSWGAFNRYVTSGPQLTKATLNEFVLKMRQSGLSPTSCNVYIRGMNSFLSWLKENEHTQEHLKIKHLKEEKRYSRRLTNGRSRRSLDGSRLGSTNGDCIHSSA